MLLVAGVVIGITVAGGGGDEENASGLDRQTIPAEPNAVEEASEETTAAVVTAAPTAPPTAVATAPPVMLVGDLGLIVPISQPSCDGSYITLIGAAIAPGNYAVDVGKQIDLYSGSNYLLTRGLCTSLRQQMPDGSDLYVIYYGPYATREEACNARAFGPSDAYVKRLDNSSDPTTSVNC